MATASKYQPVSSSVIDLKPSKTYAVREVEFHRYTRPGFPVGGVLQINEYRKLGSKQYSRRYAVCELPFREGRRFRVAKPLAEQDNDGPYFVHLSGKPGIRCTCKAAMKGVQCVHVEAMRELARQNLLPKHPGCPGT